MPVYRFLEVHVTDKHNKPLPEWGTRKLDRQHLTTTYIQSETGLAFRIAIKPVVVPFPEHDVLTVSEAGSHSSSPPSNSPQETRSGTNSDVKEAADPRSHVSPEAAESLSDAPQDHTDGSTTVSTRSRPAPWHLLATLRLDGKRAFERRTSVFLDRNHKHFPGNDGEVIMRGRTVQADDGSLREYCWYFEEVGIETAFDELFLGTSDVVPASDEDDLISALGGLGSNGLEDAEVKLQAGQIEITFQRVTLRGIDYNVGFSAEPDQDMDIDGEVQHDAISSKITHTTARDRGSRVRRQLTAVNFKAYDEPPYATFRFYYRGEDVLRKFGFEGFAKKLAEPSVRRRRQDALAKACAEPLSAGSSLKSHSAAPHDIASREGTSKLQAQRRLSSSDDEPKKRSLKQTAINKSLPSLLDQDARSNSDAPYTPPDSPNQQVDSSSDDDGSDPDTAKERFKAKLSMPAFSAASPTAGSYGQSSADESPPMKLPGISKSSAGSIYPSSMMEGNATDGEEADDEGSDDDRPLHLFDFGEDRGEVAGDSDEDDGDVVDDQGLGEQLGSLAIRKRNVSPDGDRGETSQATTVMVKKARTSDESEGGGDLGVM